PSLESPPEPTVNKFRLSVSSERTMPLCVVANPIAASMVDPDSSGSMAIKARQGARATSALSNRSGSRVTRDSRDPDRARDRVVSVLLLDASAQLYVSYAGVQDVPHDRERAPRSWSARLERI